MKKIILAFILLLSSMLYAQKYMTQNGVISFYSSTPIEDIEAVNNQVSAILDMEKKEIAAILLMKAFSFEKALMQEHFNEKFVESERFPKATFKGKVTDLQDFNAVQEQEITLDGEMNIHGISKPLNVKGSLSKQNGSLKAYFNFKVNPADYDIKIPATVREKIAKEVQVKVNFEFQKI